MFGGSVLLEVSGPRWGFIKMRRSKASSIETLYLLELYILTKAAGIFNLNVKLFLFIIILIHKYKDNKVATI